MRASEKILGGLVAYLSAAKIVFDLFPVSLKNPGQAADLSWTTIGVCSVLGAVGLYLARRTGFPEVLDAKISHRQRFLLPAIYGTSIGVVMVGIDYLHPLNIPNVAFPMSLILYPFGAIVTEIALRIFLLPLLLWLVSTILLRNKSQHFIFLGIAAVASLAEPLMQLPSLQLTPPIYAILFVIVYAFNLIQALLFRKAGFLAPLTMRLAYYLIWHILHQV